MDRETILFVEIETRKAEYSARIEIFEEWTDNINSRIKMGFPLSPIEINIRGLELDEISRVNNLITKHTIERNKLLYK